MASFPPSEASVRGTSAAAPADTSVGFALEELAACWSQAYEAIARGDLQCIDALLTQADIQVAAAGDGATDTPAEAELRKQAATAYGLLQHGMQTGLEGIRNELGQLRRGKKVLRGYGHNGNRGVGDRLEKEI